MPLRYQRTSSAQNVLSQVISKKRFRGRLGKLLLKKTWKNAVGELIADNSRPLYIKGKTLVLAVESSSWANEIQYYKDTILENVNREYRNRKLTELRVKVTNLPVRNYKFQGPPLPELDDIDMERAENITKNIKDKDLKESIDRAYKHNLQNKKWVSESIVEELGEE